VVVKRVPDTEGYEAFEPQLIERLPEVRSRLIEADLGAGNGRGDDLHSPGGAEAMAVGHSRCPKSLSPGPGAARCKDRRNARRPKLTGSAHFEPSTVRRATARWLRGQGPAAARSNSTYPSNQTICTSHQGVAWTPSGLGMRLPTNEAWQAAAMHPDGPQYASVSLADSNGTTPE
jgi:hypothetical protein